MPTIRKIQPTFSGGEIAPGLQGRVDLAKYSTGLNTAKNFIIHPKGGASNRPGLPYIAESFDSTKKCRLVDFVFSSTDAYILEFGEYYIRFFKNGAPVLADAALISDFDPSAGYGPGVTEWTKTGRYRKFDLGSFKHLTVSAPYGNTASTVQIALASNVSDSLTAVWSAPTLSIGLANATPAKNAANLIQAAVRAADVQFADWYVTESTNYASARPTTGVSFPTALMTAGDKLYFYTNIYAQGASGTNTNYFPGGDVFEWSEETAYSVCTPYPEAEIPNLQFAQSADTVYIANGGSGGTTYQYYPHKLVRSGNAAWTLSVISTLHTPAQPVNIDTAKTMTMEIYDSSAGSPFGKLTCGAAHFDSDMVPSTPFFIPAHFPPDTDISSLASSSTSNLIIGKGVIHVNTTGTWAGTLEIQINTDPAGAEGGWNARTIKSFVSNSDKNFDQDIAIPGFIDDVPVPVYIRAKFTRTSGTVVVTMQSESFDHTYRVTPSAYVSATELSLGYEGQLYDYVFPTVTNWAAGAWCPFYGWPGVVAFHEDRLGFANTPTQPQTTWLSQTGDYENFDVSDPIEDTDSISVNTPSRRVNEVRHLVSFQSLVCLTAGAEITIGPGSSGILSPTSIEQRVNGYWGSSKVRPVVVGNRIIYVEPQGAVVRDIGNDLSVEGLAGEDISIISGHLFDGYEITDLIYQQSPDSLLWALRDDGVLLSCAYMREQQVLAWSHHETDGTFESIATIPGSGYDEVWAVVKRGSKRFIERMAQRMASDEPEDQFFVDCGITYDSTPTTTITGLSHLEGKTVSILADGVDLPSQVVASGQITLAVAASVVQVGLPYVSDIQSLKPELQLSDGPLHGRKVRCGRVVIKVLDSRGGKVGADENHLYDLNMKSLATLEDPLALVSGDIKHGIASDWDNGGQIFLRQDRPLPITVLSFTPELTVGG